jgi:prepilin-type N-terminal cleavage/methylation domain-containing protein/prepilin-type processing-associated H-X9-DG protein
MVYAYRKVTSCSDRAFTLMELLVVISLLALLLAMLMPNLRASRAEARRLKCSLQLGQIGRAFHIYCDEHESYFPWPAATRSAMVFGGRAGTYGGYRAADGYSPSSRALNQYLGVTGNAPDDSDVLVFLCPDDGGAKAWDPNSETTYSDVGSSYAYNAWAAATGADTLRGCKMTRVENPSLTIMAGDHPIHNYTQGGDRQQYWHHPKRIMANILFVDTHVDFHEVEPGLETDDYTWLP